MPEEERAVEHGKDAVGGIPPGRHAARIQASRSLLNSRPQNHVGVQRTKTEPLPVGSRGRQSLSSAQGSLGEWDAPSEATIENEGGKGALGRLKERVQGMAAKQAQVQVEKEIRAANEFRTKVGATVEDKLTGYSRQMQAANRNIATVTANLQQLASVVSEEKIKSLLVGIVEPYFETLARETGKSLRDMEEANARCESERSERLQRRLEESQRCQNNLEEETRRVMDEAAVKMEELRTLVQETQTNTAHQLTDLHGTFRAIKTFTDSIPETARQSQEAAEQSSRQLVQSAETFTKQLIDTADSTNRAETLQLSQFRATELRKVEASLQALGQDVLAAVRKELSDLTASMSRETHEKVEEVNAAVLRGKVHAEYVSDAVSRVDRNLEKTLERLAGEVKGLNEEVVHTLEKSKEVDRAGRQTIERLCAGVADATGLVGTVAETLEAVKSSMEVLSQKIVQDDQELRETFEDMFQLMKKESGLLLEKQLESFARRGKIATAEVSNVLDRSAELAASTAMADFNRIKMDSGVFFDSYLTKFAENTTNSSAKVAKTFDSSAMEAGAVLEGKLGLFKRDGAVFLDDYRAMFEQNTAKAAASISETFVSSTEEADVSLRECFSRIIEDDRVFLDGRVEHFQINATKTSDAIHDALARMTTEANKTCENSAEKIRQDSADFLDQYAQKIEDLSTKANDSFVATLESSSRKTITLLEESSSVQRAAVTAMFETSRLATKCLLDEHIEQIKLERKQSEENMVATFEQSIKETERSLLRAAKQIQICTSDGGKAIMEAVVPSRQATELSKSDFVDSIKNESRFAGEALTRNFDVLAESTERSLDAHVKNTQLASDQGGDHIRDMVDRQIESRVEDMILKYARERESFSSISRTATLDDKLAIEICTERMELASSQASQAIRSAQHELELSTEGAENSLEALCRQIRQETVKAADIISSTLSNSTVQASDTLCQHIDRTEGLGTTSNEALLRTLHEIRNYCKAIRDDVASVSEELSVSLCGKSVNISVERTSQTEDAAALEQLVAAISRLTAAAQTSCEIGLDAKLTCQNFEEIVLAAKDAIDLAVNSILCREEEMKASSVDGSSIGECLDLMTQSINTLHQTIAQSKSAANTVENSGIDKIIQRTGQIKQAKEEVRQIDFASAILTLESNGASAAKTLNDGGSILGIVDIETMNKGKGLADVDAEGVYKKDEVEHLHILVAGKKPVEQDATSSTEVVETGNTETNATNQVPSRPEADPVPACSSSRGTPTSSNATVQSRTLGWFLSRWRNRKETTLAKPASLLSHSPIHQAHLDSSKDVGLGDSPRDTNDLLRSDATSNPPDLLIALESSDVAGLESQNRNWNSLCSAQVEDDLVSEEREEGWEEMTSGNMGGGGSMIFDLWWKSV